MATEWWNYKPNPALGDIPGREMIIPGSDCVVERCRIPEYCKPEYGAQIQMWSQWKTLGPPWNGGWAEWPALFVDIIHALETEYRKRCQPATG